MSEQPQTADRDTGAAENPPPQGDSGSFLEHATHDKQTGLIGEFVGFMKENAAWWLTPILVVFGLLGLLLLLGSTGIAPFIYTLF